MYCRCFEADIWIPDLYDLCDLYDLAHVAVWEPCILRDLRHVAGVGSILCTDPSQPITTAGEELDDLSVDR